VWVLLGAVKGVGRKRLTTLGILSLVALGTLYLGPMLVLWAIPEAAAAMALIATSFGFGWGVLLAGAILLLIGGAVRESALRA
jgi:hypothetical protein